MTVTGPVYLLRHGETVFNAEGRYQGQADSPLTAQGRRQAEAVGALLAARLTEGPLRLVASPLPRALATAEIVARACADRPGGTPVVERDGRLMEVAMGAWDGLTRAEITARWPDARKGLPRRAWVFHGPGGERAEAVLARLSAATADLDDRPTILVSHAMTGRLIRGLHAGLSMAEALALDAPQDAAFLLHPGGGIECLETEAHRARLGLFSE